MPSSPVGGTLCLRETSDRYLGVKVAVEFLNLLDRLVVGVDSVGVGDLGWEVWWERDVAPLRKAVRDAATAGPGLLHDRPDPVVDRPPGVGQHIEPIVHLGQVGILQDLLCARVGLGGVRPKV